MTRLHAFTLAALCAVSPALHAFDWPAMPTWATWENISSYLTKDALRNGWDNTVDAVSSHATVLKEKAQEHPYAAAGIAAGTIGLGGVLYAAKQKYNAYKQRQQEAYKQRQQEANDRVYAYIVQQELNDYTYAIELHQAEGVDSSMQQLQEDAQLAQQLQEQLDAFFNEHDQDSFAVARQFYDEYEVQLQERAAQIEQDAAYAHQIAAQG